MRVLCTTQHTHAWWESRRACVTGSKVAAALAFLKRGEKRGGDMAERYAYKIKLVTEIRTKKPVMDGFLSDDMRWGVENEDLAAAAYEMRCGISLDTSGFVLHDSIDRFGGSPDRFQGDDGLVEIKCPRTTTHYRWLLDGRVPEEHVPQMTAYLAITGRQWCQFVSFDPRAAKPDQLFTVRLQRDEKRIAEMEAGVIQFLAEVDELVQKLEMMNPATAVERTRKQFQAAVDADVDPDASWEEQTRQMADMLAGEMTP